jgi:Nucleotidyl transferase AbiEii toxin, Type IV TA system
MSQVSRDTPAGEAYLDLQRQARASGRPTDELIQLYVLEGFLARLAASPAREKFVLKGGVLLAAFGNRRPTRDVDLAGLGVSNDAQEVLGLVRSVLAVPPLAEDGIKFHPDSATAEAIREEDEYPGVRVSVDALLARARPRFHVDVNVGDPIWPEPTVVSVPRLRGGKPVALAGYPLHMVHAEKMVTAVQRGTANTRWRDFADIWTLSNHHRVDGSDLQNAIGEVARYRRAALVPLREVLDG